MSQIKAHWYHPHAAQFAPHFWRVPSMISRPYETCSYCGSIHPAQLALAIVGHHATVELAVAKYGWPHKLYATGPSIGRAIFYTEHLQDTSPADRDAIERALGLRIWFKGQSVGWSPYGDGT